MMTAVIKELDRPRREPELPFAGAEALGVDAAPGVLAANFSAVVELEGNSLAI